jgi:enterochelin esterase-like enzyme
MKDLFVDRLVNVSVLAGVARLDFARVDNVNPEDKKIQMSNSYRVALPLDALVHLAEQSSKVVEELKKQAANQSEAQGNELN